ncbi:hypothetical protein ES705_22054 [subsurface metagenome]
MLTITITSNFTYTTKLYDVSPHLEYEFQQERDVFSVCIHMPVNQGALVGMISKEFVETEKSEWPRLIFSYPSQPISFIPLWALLFIMVLSIISIVFYIKKQEWLKKRK